MPDSICCKRPWTDDWKVELSVQVEHVSVTSYQGIHVGGQRQVQDWRVIRVAALDSGRWNIHHELSELEVFRYDCRLRRRCEIKPGQCQPLS